LSKQSEEFLIGTVGVRNETSHSVSAISYGGNAGKVHGLAREFITIGKLARGGLAAPRAF
jgi:hypothetical protein